MHPGLRDASRKPGNFDPMLGRRNGDLLLAFEVMEETPLGDISSFANVLDMRSRVAFHAKNR